MATDIRDISILDKAKISSSEVISYLETINASNSYIISILKRKPQLPHYEDLPWVKISEVSLRITKKLKSHIRLNQEEKIQLKDILADVAKNLKKNRGLHGINGNSIGLENYIKTLK